MEQSKLYAMNLAGELVKASLSNHAHHASKDAGKRIAEMYEIVYRKIVELMEEGVPAAPVQDTTFCKDAVIKVEEKGGKEETT